MSYIFLIILAGLLLVVGMQVLNYFKSKKIAGTPIPFEKIDKSISEKIKNKESILYSYSPTCKNCKIQTTIIENLKKELDSIISIDVSKDLTTARTFRIMGTPSLLYLGTKNIQGIYLGFKNENFIREKFKGLS